MRGDVTRLQPCLQFELLTGDGLEGRLGPSRVLNVPDA